MDDLTDDQLDTLHDRLNTAEQLLADTVSYLAATHRYASPGSHDILGEGYGCAGCDLHTRIDQHLNPKEG